MKSHVTLRLDYCNKQKQKQKNENENVLEQGYISLLAKSFFSFKFN